MSERYKPSEYKTVTEQLVNFRGRCLLKQHIPSEPGKYDIKVEVFCESTTSSVLHSPICKGGIADQLSKQNQGERAVLDMIFGFKNSGRSDNFFTSFGLQEKLLAKKLTFLGTI